MAKLNQPIAEGAPLSVQCEPSTEPAFLISLFNLFVSLALMLLPHQTTVKNSTLATTD
ncbi:Hypothetical protein SMAX5B_003218 [Scophthalmus maximus]|uniref:Uncharacterized protein n=1 Tax=Scophthalmus maximus TaxID=52904 RepID=A0A2U9BDI9_SCOMX|nr:Hypothetical protein SMAX5B_003218 [Scophthalmus maximus]